jgi:hypothetical protein
LGFPAQAKTRASYAIVSIKLRRKTSMKTSQKGFGTVPVLLIIFVLLGLGFAGYRVWDMQKKDVNKQDSTEQIASTTYSNIEKSEETNVPSEAKYVGEIHTSSKGKFKMTVLNGWKIKTDTTYDYFFSYDTQYVKYDASKKPEITPTDASGVGGFVPGIMVSINEYNQDITHGDAFVLNDGTKGLCTSKTYSEQELEEANGASSGQGKFVSKQCLFKKNDLKLQTIYGYYEKSPLDVESVEWAFKTIEIQK